MRTLYGFKTSPWTERARWALDHHRIAYTYHEHVPLLGEPLLRAAFGPIPAGGQATVPLLVDGDERARSSTDIARYADRVGSGPPLFPAGQDVARWDHLTEAILRAARGVVIARTAASAAAKRESLPGFVPGPLRPLLTPVAAVGAAFLARKYASRGSSVEAAEDSIRPKLAEARSALGGRDTMLSAFSWADICLASALQCVKPHERAPLGPAMREVWTMPRLAAEFADLLAWRDVLVGRHR